MQRKWIRKALKNNKIILELSLLVLLILFINDYLNINMNLTCLFVVVVLDTNQWFHATVILGNSISIAIGSEYD